MKPYHLARRESASAGHVQAWFELILLVPSAHYDSQGFQSHAVARASVGLRVLILAVVGKKSLFGRISQCSTDVGPGGTSDVGKSSTSML